jgi:diacylglycerol kinase (ATP)
MRVRVIINPSAGRQIFQKNTSKILDNLLADQTFTTIDLIETAKAGDAYSAAFSFQPWDNDLILAVGGDGTVNEVVNGLLAAGHHKPLAILPAGTANDFAYAMKIPRDIDGFCQMIRRFHTTRIDVGRIGSSYFLNVAAGGMLTDVPYKVTSDAKTVLGQLAYVLSGAFDLPAQLFQSFPITLHSHEKNIEEEILLFIVANTRSVGGFRNLAPSASVHDGLLDVLVIHKQNIFELVPLLLQLVNGEHVNNPKVTYFQTSHLEINCRGNCTTVPLDLDGEPGPRLPAVIEVLPKAIRLVI